LKCKNDTKEVFNKHPFSFTLKKTLAKPIFYDKYSSRIGNGADDNNITHAGQGGFFLIKKQSLAPVL